MHGPIAAGWSQATLHYFLYCHHFLQPPSILDEPVLTTDGDLEMLNEPMNSSAIEEGGEKGRSQVRQ